jgi:hypothetical protein
MTAEPSQLSPGWRWGGKRQGKLSTEMMAHNNKSSLTECSSPALHAWACLNSSSLGRQERRRQRQKLYKEEDAKLWHGAHLFTPEQWNAAKKLQRQRNWDRSAYSDSIIAARIKMPTEIALKYPEIIETARNLLIAKHSLNKLKRHEQA